jgi:threonine aldolase
MILGDRAHIFRSEQGGASALGSVHPHTIRNQPDGTMELDEVEAAIRADDPHQPRTRLVCVENTHNFCGGRVLPVAYMDALGDLAHRHGLSLHVDGARIWNAAVALNVPAARLVQSADSVSVCLSKGLSAPVGSVVASNAEFVRRARRSRKVVGGAMRQAGILAAAGIIAVTEMVERLADDHANAAALAQGLARLDGVEIDPATVETNILFFTLTHPELTSQQFVHGLRERGVLINASSDRRLRMVLNRHVTADDVPVVLGAMADVLAQGAAAPAGRATVYG